MIGEMDDAEKAASIYEAEIRNAFPGPCVPCFDLVLLGIGEDGHTASLFPGTKWDEEKLVVANRVPKTGDPRLSMTPRILNEAETVIFLVSGTVKSRVVAELLENPTSPLPASRIHPARGSLLWLMDNSAASLI
jgi:6-phosphogluconolactonase